MTALSNCFDSPRESGTNHESIRRSRYHSAGMVLTQPHLSSADWQAEVEKMRNAYKAPIADADVPAIVDYLANLKSAN